MQNKLFLILLFWCLLQTVDSGATLFEVNETISSDINNGLLDLQINFSFVPNKGSIYRINFTNQIGSLSSLSLSYKDAKSHLLTSSAAAGSDNKYIVESGETLSMSYEKQICDPDTVVTRNSMINILNQSSALINIKVEIITDTGDCSDDGSVGFPTFPIIFTIWMNSIIVKNRRIRVLN